MILTLLKFAINVMQAISPININKPVPNVTWPIALAVDHNKTHVINVKINILYFIKLRILRLCHVFHVKKINSAKNVKILNFVNLVNLINLQTNYFLPQADYLVWFVLILTVSVVKPKTNANYVKMDSLAA